MQGGPNRLRNVNFTRLRAESSARIRVRRVRHLEVPTKFSNQDK